MRRGTNSPSVNPEKVNFPELDSAQQALKSRIKEKAGDERITL